MNRKKKHSFFADTQLQYGQIKKKMVAKFNKSLFILKTTIFKSQNDHNLSSKETRYLQLELFWKLIGPINSEF